MSSQCLPNLFTGCWSGRAGRKSRNARKDEFPRADTTTISPPVSMSIIFDEIPEATPRPQRMRTRTRIESPALFSTLSNYEITETVFSHLPLEDLVKATSVCPRWHEIITTSKTLRTRLLDERIPKMISKPDSLQKQYNITNGHYWFFRTQPSSLYSPENKICIVIFRTPTTHLELLISQRNPRVINLDPSRTRLFGSFAGLIWRVDGYDVDGEVAWKDLCGIHCEPSVGLCSYAWRYLLPRGRERLDALPLTESRSKGMLVATTVRFDELRIRGP